MVVTVVVVAVKRVHELFPSPSPPPRSRYRTVKGELQKRKEEEYSSIFFSTTIFRSHPFPLGLWWIRAESYARAIDHAA